MTVGLKEPCPCGSGKRYKHCHYGQDRRRSKQYVWLGLAAAFVIALGAVVYFGRSRGVGAAGSAATAARVPLSSSASTTPATGQASNNQSPLPGGRAPQAWEYDAANSRHWDPNHKHWHEGAPPPEPMRTNGVSATARSSNGSPVQVNSSTNAVNLSSAVDQSPLPDGSAPKPNQYDPAKNRYWSAGHNHWHAGQPPATPAPGTATTVTTSPATGTTKTPAPTGGR